MKCTRRGFLGAAAAGGVLVTVSTPDVQGQQTYSPPSIPAGKSRLHVLNERTGSKITSIQSFVKGEVGFVRVRTDSGAEGWGQISPYDADITATILHRKVAGYALGQDPADVDLIVDRCIEGNYKFPWSYVCRALTGVETGIWDLLGKHHGRSVCELLGGKPHPISVYGSSMSRTIKPAEEAARLARLRDQFGYRAFKVRVGKVNGHDEDEWPGRTEELIPAVREGVGPGVDLLADGNSCYSPGRAIEVGRRLEDYGYTHFEEPCPYWELEWTAQVARALDIPVAGGEQDNDLAQWRRMIRMQAVDIVQPDICYIGGLVRALRVAEMAREMGMDCVPHSANLSMVTVFTLHMMGAIPNAGDHVEFSIERSPWTDGLYSPALEVVDGKVAIPDGPGWGVNLNPEWVSQAAHQISEA